MKLKLQLAAFALAFASLVFWFFGGPHFGWTKTTPVATPESTTAGTAVPMPAIFTPGLDLLAACWLAAGALLAGSCLGRRR